jgi:hypothetical protein
MKCANCRNEDERFLWDEGDTIYCSLCHLRTNKDSGDLDLVECPNCGKLKDRKAWSCPHCGGSGY